MARSVPLPGAQGKKKKGVNAAFARSGPLTDDPPRTANQLFLSETLKFCLGPRCPGDIDYAGSQIEVFFNILTLKGA
ncbi:MAG: hypothetical protein WBM29_13120, partial [Candidatus Deferrimicrobium sp.]